MSSKKEKVETGVLTQQREAQEVRDDKGNLVNRMVRESSQAQKGVQHGILLADRANMGLQQDPRVRMMLCAQFMEIYPDDDSDLCRTTMIS